MRQTIIDRCRREHKTDYTDPANRQADLRRNAIDKMAVALSAVVAWRAETGKFGVARPEDVCDVIDEATGDGWEDLAVSPREDYDSAIKSLKTLAKAIEDAGAIIAAKGDDPLGRLMDHFHNLDTFDSDYREAMREADLS